MIIGLKVNIQAIAETYRDERPEKNEILYNIPPTPEQE
jgi:hypothetical protein